MAQSLRICVTGGTSGIGLQLCKNLAAEGHTVLCVARSPQRFNAAFANVPARDRVKLVQCSDLGNFSAVRAAAKTLQDENSDGIDALVLNAGVLMQSLQTTQGVENTLATNHLGQFLLAHELLPLLSKAPKPRVVIVSSELHKRSPPTTAARTLAGRPPLFDLSPGLAGFLSTATPDAPPPVFKGMEAYSVSKLYNVWAASALAARAQRAGLGKLWVAAVTPGFVPATDLSRYSSWSWLGKWVLPWLPMTVSVAEGTRRVHVVTAAPNAPDRAPSGTYWSRGAPAPSPCVDMAAAEALWGLSMQVLGLEDFLGDVQPLEAAKGSGA